MTMIFDELYADTVGSVSRAVHAKDLNLLQELLQNGSSTNGRDNRGWTPLHVAASEGYVEAARHLLLADDIQVEGLTHSGLTPLYLACCGDTDEHKRMVELLLSARADPDMANGDKYTVPLHVAIENNNIEVVKMLLEAGGDPNIVSFKCSTGLHIAAEMGTLEMAELLLDRGGSLNVEDQTVEDTALHILCLFYRPQCAKSYNTMLDLFLRHGADINAQMADGATPLMLAIQRCWEWGVDKLLEQGADVHLMKSGNALALHVAIQFFPDPSRNGTTGNCTGVSTLSVLEKLLGRMDQDKIPREGFSIFHMAIQWEKYEGLRLLVNHGLNPDEFLQEMEGAIIDCEEKNSVPLVVNLRTYYDTPLGFLLFQSLNQTVVDTAKFLIDKGSCINALRPGVLPPLVAALKNSKPSAYENKGLGNDILQYLLHRGADIMHKSSKNDLLPDALTVSSLFNVVGFFRLLQHGVPVHQLYTHATLKSLMDHYKSVLCYKAFKLFPWLVVSWLCTVNMFISQLPIDVSDIFSVGWEVKDEHLSHAWHELRDLVSSPKSLQLLCVLKVRLVLGEARGWKHLQQSLKQLHISMVLPDPVVDLLHFRWVKTDTLHLRPTASSLHLYISPITEPETSDEEFF